ncbi:MAG: hypothetical protein KDH96_10895 [Candidatus Riesia sp.]|nr:hypothetical protein [Candidatus Riesia sp.]
MKFVQIGSKVNGRFKKNEQYSVEEFLDLVVPGWFATKRGIEKRIDELIRKDN